MPNGVWSQISQYWVDGMTLMLSLMPAGASWPWKISQTCCCHGPLVLPQSMLISSPSAWPASASSFLACSMSGFSGGRAKYSGWTGETW